MTAPPQLLAGVVVEVVEGTEGVRATDGATTTPAAAVAAAAAGAVVVVVAEAVVRAVTIAAAGVEGVDAAMGRLLAGPAHAAKTPAAARQDSQVTRGMSA
jgi:hypothetical protein